MHPGIRAIVKLAGLTPPGPKVTGQLRLSTTMSNVAPVGQLKPKTIKPKPGPGLAPAKTMPTAAPPSKTKYYRDATATLASPQRGTRP